MKGRSGVRRLNVNLPESSYAKLEEVARNSHHSMSEVVRQGLSLVILAEKGKREGKTLMFADSDGEKTTEIILLE